MPEMLSSPLPNIIFILSDDQGCWALGAAGNSEIHTPNLDRLAGEGMRFANFFCASPVCSPARASLLTGRIPSQHGVHDWLRSGNLAPEAVAHLDASYWSEHGPAVEYLAGMRTYTQILAENGYTCGLSGKWHLGDSLHPQQGFSFWRAVPYGGSDYFNAPFIRDGQVVLEPGYLTDAITDNALDFLNQQLGRPEPFYLSVHHNAPHSPWETRQHPQELRDLYRDCPFDSVPELPAHPLQINSAPRGTGARRRELLTGYYAAISGVDRSLGRILDWLEEHQLREKTLIVFSGDNGMNMGHHGLWGKGNATFPLNLYEESVKVPFIMAHSGTIPAAVSTDLLSHYDFMPTLLDYLGLAHPEAHLLPGHSFAPLLRGEMPAAKEEMPAAKEEMLAAKEEMPVFVCDEYGPARMIRTRRWKYTHRYPYGPHELYDLESDPGEENNRVEDPATAAISAELKARLDEWYARYADPRVDGTREAVYGKGQLERAGVLSQGRPAYAADWWYIDADGKRKSSTDLEE